MSVIRGDETFGRINFRPTQPSTEELVGREGMYDISGVKKSASDLMANRIMKTKSDTSAPKEGETKEGFWSRAMKGNLTDDEYMKLSLGQTAVGTAAGLYDLGQEFKRGQDRLAKDFESSERIAEATAEFKQEQSRADFEQAMQQREAQFQLTQEVREKQFNASMDMIAERSGIAKDQLMNDVQFSQTVANINELNSLLNLAKQQQPAGENTQQFFS